MTFVSSKRLLILYHSQSGNTERMAQAVYTGALQEVEVETRLIRAFDADIKDLIRSDAAAMQWVGLDGKHPLARFQGYCGP